jgi:hypothetical protein
MNNTMSRPEPTDEQRGRLREVVREVAWQHAREKAGLQAGDPPRNPFDADALDAAGQRDAVLAHLMALREVSDLAEQLITVTVTVAGETGAGGALIGEALGVTRSAVRKRWPDVVAGSPGPRRATFTTAHSDEWTDAPDQPGLRRLAQIEAQLTNDVLTDDELATALHDAGLPELARVIGHLA